MTAHSGITLQNHLLSQLEADKVVTCMMVRMSRGSEVARVAKAAGFDALYVDLEHAPLTLDTTGQICMTAQDLGVTPMVRLPSFVPETVGQVLDCGAMGVILPGITTGEGAHAAVQSIKYPPWGMRSVASGLPQIGFSNAPQDEISGLFNRNTVLSLMIENQEALDHVDEIASVEGVNLLHLGMNDMAAATGMTMPWTIQTVRPIFAKVIAAARRHNCFVGVGGLAGEPEILRELLHDGVRFVSAGTDLSFMLSAATAKARAIRALT